MTCTAPESERLHFLATGALEPAEREEVSRHVGACESCREELAELRRLGRHLGALHLSPEEIVAAAAAGREPDHVRECRQCRHDLDLMRLVERDLRPRPALAARPWMAAAAGVAAALLGGNLWLVSQNRALTRRVSEAGHAAERAAEAERRARTEVREREALREEVQALSRPSVNVAIVDLEPPGALRGGEAAQRVEVPAGAEAVTFIVSVAGTAPLPSYSLEVLSGDGTLVWGGSGLRRNDLDTVTVSSPRRLLPAGEYRFRLTGPDRRPVLREWRVIVR